jgi:hypothetical protein
MVSTYTAWIHHGEAQLDAVINEQADHIDEQYSMNDDVSMNESEHPEDRLPDMVQELFTAAEEGAQNYMFAVVLEEISKNFTQVHHIFLSDQQCCLLCNSEVVIIGFPTVLCVGIS